MEKRAECPKCGKQNAQWKQLDHVSSCCLNCGDVMFHKSTRQKDSGSSPRIRRVRNGATASAEESFSDLCLWPFKGFVSAIYHVA